jgi:hypothetical protein
MSELLRNPIINNKSFMISVLLVRQFNGDNSFIALVFNAIINSYSIEFGIQVPTLAELNILLEMAV